MGLLLPVRDRGDQQHQRQGPDHVHLDVLRGVVAGAEAPHQLLRDRVDGGQDGAAQRQCSLTKLVRYLDIIGIFFSGGE